MTVVKIIQREEDDAQLTSQDRRVQRDELVGGQDERVRRGGRQLTIRTKKRGRRRLIPIPLRNFFFILLHHSYIFLVSQYTVHHHPPNHHQSCPHQVVRSWPHLLQVVGAH